MSDDVGTLPESMMARPTVMTTREWLQTQLVPTEVITVSQPLRRTNPYYPAAPEPPRSMKKRKRRRK